MPPWTLPPPPSLHPWYQLHNPPTLYSSKLLIVPNACNGKANYYLKKPSFIKYLIFKFTRQQMQKKKRVQVWLKLEPSLQTMFEFGFSLTWLHSIVKLRSSLISSFFYWDSTQIHYQAHIKHIIKPIWFWHVVPTLN